MTDIAEEQAKNDAESTDYSSFRGFKSLDEHISSAPRMLHQMTAYLQLMEERMQFLEHKIKKLEGQDTESPIPMKKPQNTTKALIPAVQRLPDLCSKSTEKLYAIDVMYDPKDAAFLESESEMKSSTVPQSYRIPGRIRLNSPAILALLERIANPHFSSQRPVIVRPFKVLCIYEDLVRQHLADLESHPDKGQDLDHIRCLLEIYDHDLAFRDRIKDGSMTEIAFQDLWHLFPLGSIVFSSDFCRAHVILNTQESSVHEHKSIESDLPSFVINCVHYDFNGDEFGPVQTNIEIPAYDGWREIKTLPIIPTQFVGDASLRIRLIQRGKRFAQLTDKNRVSHMYYSGTTLDEVKIEVDGEVVIDFQLAHQMLQLPVPALGLSRHMSARAPVISSSCGSSGCKICNSLDRDDIYELKRRQAFISDWSNQNGILVRREELNDMQYLLLPYRTYGFSLRTRKWCCLHVDHLSEIRFSSGFEDLVLPAGHKSIILSMVNMHFPSLRDSINFDLTSGLKGRGLVILLHGAPGVGKTATVEAVASYTHRPLMYLAAADLGLTSDEIERNLEKTFALATKWGCILLLSEADIILATRTRHDLVQSAMSSTFLRCLEYFSGILFMITDKIGTIDEACKSRIHISLSFPQLTAKVALQIWKINLRRIKSQHQSMKVEGTKIMIFAKEAIRDGLRWNGRQIRNAFQAALALAEYGSTGAAFSDDSDSSMSSGKPEEKHKTAKRILGPSHFQSVVAASKAFDEYLNEMYMGTESNSYERMRSTEPRAAARKSKKTMVSSSSDPESSDSDTSDSESSDEWRKKKTKKNKKQTSKDVAEQRSRCDDFLGI